MGFDYYAILDVSRSANLLDIRLAYRKLALRLHPQRKSYPQHPLTRPDGVFDLPLPTLAENIYWQLVCEAYEVLVNPLHRQVFDLYGEEGLKRGVPAPMGFIQPYKYHCDPMKTYFEFFASYSPYADLIDAATNPPPLYEVREGVGVKHKNPTVEKLLPLELEEVFHGGSKLVKITRSEFVDNRQQVREVLLTVPIAKGTLEGTKIHFSGAGDSHETRIAGDVDFIVCDKPHNVFRRDKWDLHMDYKVTLKEALTGFKLSLLSIDGRLLELLITDVVE